MISIAGAGFLGPSFELGMLLLAVGLVLEDPDRELEELKKSGFRCDHVQ